jgi:hypothetical protein
VSTYVAATGLAQLDHAQAVIDRHLISCLVCGTNRPCRERRDAEAVFMRTGRLPRRTPGLAGGSTMTPATFSWFDDAARAERTA